MDIFRQWPTPKFHFNEHVRHAGATFRVRGVRFRPTVIADVWDIEYYLMDIVTDYAILRTEDQLVAERDVSADNTDDEDETQNGTDYLIARLKNL